jgi:hypothetical protein
MLAVHVRRRPGPPGWIAALEQAEPAAGGAAVLEDAVHDRACDQVFAAIGRDNIHGEGRHERMRCRCSATQMLHRGDVLMRLAGVAIRRSTPAHRRRPPSVVADGCDQIETRAPNSRADRMCMTGSQPSAKDMHRARFAAQRRTFGVGRGGRATHHIRRLGRAPVQRSLSGHLRDAQVRVGELELVHLDDSAARIARGPVAHVVGRRLADFHRAAGLPGRGGAT